jgi:uncharacterized protein YfaS (alpha-2-macroglobulin family)
MKKFFGALIALSALLSLIFITDSCSRFGKSKAPSSEFATYIKAYTGGIISDKATIRIEFTSNIQDVSAGTEGKEGLFKFSPSIKGSTRWISPKIIEFIPEQGALKPGQTYTCKFSLDKIMKIENRRLHKFVFQFMVAMKEASLDIDNVIITAGNPNFAEVDGTIALNDSLPLETVKKMISYDFPSDSVEVGLMAGQDAQHFRVEVSNLQRASKDKKLKLWLDPGKTGFVTNGKLETVIPATGHFKVLNANLKGGSEPYIDVEFTEALEDVSDDSGLITLSGVEKFTSQTQDNRIRIYPEGPFESVSLTVSDAVRSYQGTPLGTEFKHTFNNQEAKPAVKIPLQGNILPNTKELILPFYAVNLKAVDISVIKIYEDNVLAFLQDNELNGSENLRRSGRLIYRRCVRLDSDPTKDLHKWQQFSVDLSGLFKQDMRAIYRIRITFKQDYSLYGKDGMQPSDDMVDLSTGDITDEDIAIWDTPESYYYDNDYNWNSYNWKEVDDPTKPSYYMDVDKYPSCNLMTSNLGVIVKSTGENKLWVSVNDILTTKPVFGSEIFVYNFQLRQIGYGKTDTKGFATIQTKGKPFAVVAKRNNVASYIKVIDGNENMLSRFDVGGREVTLGLKGFIYGERGVWRPGDTLHVTMILDDKENKIPDSHPVIMELYTPQGQFYNKIICSNATNGFYTYNVPTASDDPTGVWNAYFKVGGATFHKALRIESIKPNRLKVNLDLGTKTIDAGAKTPIRIASNWLTGPAASGLTAKVKMTLSTGGTYFKGFEGYTFVDPLSKFTGSSLNLVNAKLDNAGKTTAYVTMPAAENAPGMLSADLVCSVEEQGGDASFNTTTMPYSPFSSYVGVKIPQTKDGSYLETDKVHNFDIAVVDKEGHRLSGKKVEYKVFKMKWSWWWENKENDLANYTEGTAGKAVQSGILTTSAKGANVAFRVNYPQWGRYMIYVKDLESGHASGGTFYVDWPAYKGRSAKADPDALTMLSFTTDKKSYKIGDIATVYIPAASNGHALVSLENARTVISEDWVETKNGEDTKYKFKVTEQMAPNFYVHVILLQPHKKSNNDLPIRMYGVQPILVDNPASVLQPVITMKSTIRPQEDFSLRVSEKNGKAMTYTIAIVDEGLLDLTSFKTPDPWKEMYEREALGVKTWDLYNQVIGAFNGKFSPMVSIGGDQSIAINSKRDNRFNPVVKFLGPFKISGSTAVHRIKLPMYVGSVRVMVVAGQNGAYGSAEKTVPVRSPLMIIPTLPRVLGVGEKVTLPVNVFAMEGGVKSANVSVSITGPVKVVGKSSTIVPFSQPGDKLVTFDLVSTGEGIAKVSINAKGGKNNASESIFISVRNPNPITVSVKNAMVGKGKTAIFKYSPFLEDNSQYAHLELSSFPSIDFNANFTYLKYYDFSCTEQLAAKGLSLIFTKKFLSLDNSRAADNMIPQILKELYARQLPDGGFSYWPGMTSSDLWASSMAGQFMLEAAHNGFEVNKGVLGGWKNFQKKGVQNYRQSSSYFLYDLLQAYRLYTLAIASEPDNGAMNRLKENKNLSDQARWMLASAYSICGKKSVAKEIIKGIERNFKPYPSSNISFGSPLRDEAIATESLVLTDNIGEALSLARNLAKAFSGSEFTTQESAFASIALGRLSMKVNRGSLKAIITQKMITKQVDVPSAVFSYPANTKVGEIAVKNTSSAPIYASFVTSVQTRFDQPVRAKSSGLSLYVRYFGPNGQRINPLSIRQGTDFSASVTITNTRSAEDYTNLALTWKIPSGWEIYNERMLGVATDNDNSFTYNDIRDDRSIYYFYLPKHSSKTFTMKLRAAYLGEFILPSIKCEAMYEPKINACTSSGHTSVTK